MDDLQDWRRVTPELHERIVPATGQLGHQISVGYLYERELASASIEIELKPFGYHDPFYGESTARSMEIELQGEGLRVSSVAELGGLELGLDDAYGSLSNSLAVAVHRCRLGALDAGQIGLDLEYSLTNSDSYAFLDGTLEEHLQERGSLAVRLDVDDLQILLEHPRHSFRKLRRSLDRAVYDVSQAERVSNGPNEPEARRRWKVPLRKRPLSWFERLAPFR